jgi:WD40 repeat protein
MSYPRAIESIAIRSDGVRVATGSWDNTARLWDATSGACVAVLEGWSGNYAPAKVAFSPDGTRLLACFPDHTARLFDGGSGVELAVLRGHSSFVNTVGFRVWDASTGVELFDLRGHSDAVNSASFSPDGTCIVTASKDGTARLWHSVPAAQRYREERRLSGASGAPR